MPRIGKHCWPLCVGNHKSPIYDNMRAVQTAGRTLRGERPVTEPSRTLGECVMPPRRQLFTYIPLAHIKPIVCPRCGEKARAVWHSPLPAGLKGEMRNFECAHCGKEMKMIVEETESQPTGAI